MTVFKQKPSEEAVKTLIDRLRLGVTERAACGIAGISRQQFRYWYDMGEAALGKNQDELTPDEIWALAFKVAVDKAQAEAEVYFFNILREAAYIDPVFAWRWLTTRRRADYGPFESTADALTVVVRYTEAVADMTYDRNQPRITQTTPQTAGLLSSSQ